MKIFKRKKKFIEYALKEGMILTGRAKENIRLGEFGLFELDKGSLVVCVRK